MDNSWLKREIAKGVTGLLALRLDGAPAADAATKTADIWLVAMTKGREWNEDQDASRIAKAFETLFANCERWPPPALLLRELPIHPVERRYIKQKRTDAQIQTGNAALDQLTAKLKRRANPGTALKSDEQIEDSKRQTLEALAELANQGTQQIGKANN